MRKNVFGRHLKRDKNERKALFKSLISSLVLNGRIKTTEAKAKAIKGQIDKVVTKAKKDSLWEKSKLERYLTKEAFKKLTKEIVLQLRERNSGYTRIIRLGQRFSDAASMVILEWVDIDQIKSSKLKAQDKSPEDKKEEKEIEEKDNQQTKEKTKTKRVKRVKKEKNEK